MTLSYINSHYRLVKETVRGTVAVVRQVARTRWALIELSGTDFLLLASSKDNNPPLPSAKIIKTAATQRELIEMLDKGDAQ